MSESSNIIDDSPSEKHATASLQVEVGDFESRELSNTKGAQAHRGPSVIGQRDVSIHSTPSLDLSAVDSIQASPSSTCSTIAGTPLHNKIMLTSANLRVIHTDTENNNAPSHPLSPYDLLGMSPSGENPVQSGLRNIIGLIAALLLTTLLAGFSALDAKNHCVSHQAYDIYEMLEEEDDAVVDFDIKLAGREECKQVFLWVMVPLCATTASLGMLSWVFTQRHLNRDSTLITALEREESRLRFCIWLLIVVSFIALAWTYGIIAIMLWPRYINFLGNANQNPYQSLAAVDFLGNVGDNANLYYTSWIGFALSLAVVYQTFMQTLAQQRRVRMAEQEHQSSMNRASSSVEAMLSCLSTSEQLKSYRKSRATWYNSIYKLRTRTGIWMAAFLSTIVVLASSLHIFDWVLYPTALAIVSADKDDDYHTYKFNGLREICGIIQTQGPQQGVPAELCARTSFSFCAASVAAILQLGAIVLHLLARKDAAVVVDNEELCTALPYHATEEMHITRFANKHIPLKWEFVLSIVLSILLGLNAILCTGVQGPAAKVGNLYYASWLSFLLCLRICLGCLEELYHIKDEQELINKTKEEEKRESCDESLRSEALKNSIIAESQSTLFKQSSEMHGTVVTSEKSEDTIESQRAFRLRIYFSLGIFSAMNFCAGLDAAYNTAGGLTAAQKYMVICPPIVAFLAAGQFLLCLKPVAYQLLSRVWFGGVMSMVTFYLWLTNLLLTMHAESSWAVNAIGEINMANLYYFTWASVFTSGMLLTSFVKDVWGFGEKDLMVMVWLGVCKVCFIIIGAGLHIWNTISDSCNVVEFQKGAVNTFCSRTVFSILVGLAGMGIGSLVLLSRVFDRFGWCCTCSQRVRGRIEAAISIFLVLLFGVAVATITGIGGPGQSVGDLYYASWLAFCVAIGVGANCFDQIKQDQQTAANSGEESPHAIPFVHMQ